MQSSVQLASSLLPKRSIPQSTTVPGPGSFFSLPLDFSMMQKLANDTKEVVYFSMYNVPTIEVNVIFSATLCKRPTCFYLTRTDPYKIWWHIFILSCYGVGDKLAHFISGPISLFLNIAVYIKEISLIFK